MSSERLMYVQLTNLLRSEGGLIFDNFYILLSFAFYLTIATFQMKTCIIFESLSRFCYKRYQLSTKTLYLSIFLIRIGTSKKGAFELIFDLVFLK